MFDRFLKRGEQMKLFKKRSHGPLAEVMNELAARVESGFGRPMTLILGTIEAIGQMSFAPEVEADTAKAFRDGMHLLMARLPTDEQIAELARELRALKEAFAAKAIR